MPADPRPPSSATLSRRTLLALAAGGALATALAACGIPDPEPSPSATSDAWMPPTSPMRFPKDYIWGSATSAYQVEGSLMADGRGMSVWDTFAAIPGAIRDGSTGDPAADQYRRYRQDIALMGTLGLGAYRFSISWPRIQPTGSGRANAVGLDHYRRLVDALREHGIRPAITLFHWDLPQALQDSGGWGERDIAERFADYASLCFDALGDARADWFTLNEPKTHAFVGHWHGAHAPGLSNADLAAAAVHHQLLAHGLAVQRFRDGGAAGRIGVALNLLPVYSTSSEETEASRHLDASENRLFLDPVLLGRYPDDAIGPSRGQLPAHPTAFAALQHDGDLDVISTQNDFLAVQYYGIAAVDDAGNPVQLHPSSAASWQQVWPEGLYDLLMRLVRDYPRIPLIVTENGIPDPTSAITVDDPHRVDFLRAHFQQAARAIGDGVPLEGHFVWSLLDNFEWAEGYQQRWGIVAVDFGTQERIPKRSAAFLSEVTAANAVAPR